MSHTVLRGKPNASQLYLDTVLDAVLEGDKVSRGYVRKRNKVNLAEVVYYCMRQRPSSIHMINGTTGEEFTNEQMLKRAVPVARALTARGAPGKAIMTVMKNHEQLVSAYYGALFAGVTIFLLDPNSTVHEIRHFLELVKPFLVFCDRDRADDVTKATQETAPAPQGVVCDDELDQFTAGQNDDLDSFVVCDAAPESTAVMLPTSGSTGLPKAGILTHRGLLAQLPSIWSYHSQFPRPTERAMVLSTAQWMTFTNMLTTCPVYDITVLLSPKKTPEYAIELFEKYRPTWVLLVPGFATILAGMVQPHQITSLQTVILTGAPPKPAVMATLKDKLPKSALLCNGYGMTETQGFTAVPEHDTPFGSPGRLFNIFDYKLVDDNGKAVGAHQNGELWLKSDDCIIKGYLNNEAAYAECMAPDGYFRTFDVFYKDEKENIFFVERKKFWFKYLNYHISPEELENIISTVPGVQDCVVCGSEAGAAAAVVVKPGCDVTREEVHRVVDAHVMDQKRLHGGIAFVPASAVPRTHSGKLHRAGCTDLLNQLIDSGHCF